MKIIFLAALLAFASYAAISPVTPFNAMQLTQGTGGLYIDWYITSVYDTTHNWTQDGCATVAFLFGENWGLMNNFSTILDSQSGWSQTDVPIYWNRNKESVIYSDQAETQVLFFVANWTFAWLEDGEEVNHAILAKPNGLGGYTFYALSSSFILGTYWDISPWLQAEGYTPVVGQNYFFLDNWCFIDAPSPVWNLYKNSGNILGNWNVLAVYDPDEMVDWNSTNCTQFTYANSSNNLYQFGFNYLNSQGNKEVEGPWALIPDPDNTTVYIGFYFGDQTSTHTVMEVFYYDVAGNLAIVDNSVCFAAFLSKKSTTINNALYKTFQAFVNLYSPLACEIHNSEAFYLPNDENCASGEPMKERERPLWHKYGHSQ